MAIDRSTARIRLAASILSVALLSAGCGDELPPGTIRSPLEVGALPENVRDAAKKALPNVTLMDAWKNLDSKTKALHSYEVRGRAGDGKIREVRVSTSGEILEME